MGRALLRRAPAIACVVFIACASRDRVEITVAVPHVRACRTGELSARYLQGGRGQGHQFGVAVIANTSPRPCRLKGPLRLRGLARDGHAVTTTMSQPIEEPLVLSPHGTTHSVPPALVAEFLFGGDARDDPSAPDGRCRRWTVPATWEARLSTGAYVRFRNGTAGSDRRFASCQVGTRLSEIGPEGVRLSDRG